MNLCFTKKLFEKEMEKWLRRMKHTLLCLARFILIIMMVSLITSCSKTRISEKDIVEEDYFGKYETVFIVGVDGAGSFIKNTDTPNFDSIFALGAISYEMKSAVPTESAQNWGSMFYGVDPVDHNINNLFAQNRNFKSDEYNSIFSCVLEKYPDSNCASIVGWNPINSGIIDVDSIYKIPASSDEQTLTCDEIVNQFEQYIIGNTNIKLVFIQIDDVDQAGHAYGWGSEEYYDAIYQADKAIGAIYKIANDSGLLNDSLFVVVSDHGGTVEKTHGGESEEEVNCCFAVCGKGILTNNKIIDMETRDVAAVTLYALGVDKPDYFTARVPMGIWENVGEADRSSSIIDHYNKYRSAHAESFSSSFNDEFEDSILYYDTFDTGLDPGIFSACYDFQNFYIDTDVEWYPSYKTASFSFWLKNNGINGDPVLLANKDWSSGYNNGVVFALRDHDIKINIGDGKNRSDILFPLPYDIEEGWSNFIFIIDFESMVVKGYCDFEYMYSVEINHELNVADVYVDNSIIIGQDITYNYPCALNACLDDLIIFNCALTGDNVNSLKRIYDNAIAVGGF